MSEIMARYALKDIKPNPFRNIKHYPIQELKIDKLRQSIRTTTFWDNIVARQRNGFAEIAYGHHRLYALRKEFEPDYSINLIVRDLDDETMIKIMANENMEEWGSSVVVEHETIRAVVEAYGKGLISLPTIPLKGNVSLIRYAPSFIQHASGDDSEHPYTAMTLAKFLGWTMGKLGEPQRRVEDALAALQYEEQGILDSSIFATLGGEQAHAVIVETRKTLRDKEAQAKIAEQEAKEAERRVKDAATQREKERHLRRQQQAEAEAKAHRKHAVSEAFAVGSGVGREIKHGAGVREAKEIAAKIKDNHRAKGVPQDINDYAHKLAIKLRDILQPDKDDRVKRLDELIKYQRYLDDSVRKELARQFAKLAERAEEYSDRFGGNNKPHSTRMLDRHSIIQGE